MIFKSLPLILEREELKEKGSPTPGPQSPTPNMCLAIPMKIISVDGSEAVVEQSGVSRKVNVALLPDLSLGDYVLVHAGFAIAKVQEEEALGTLELMRELKFR